MIKLFDKNVVYFDFYTDNPKVQKYFPIQPSRNYIPDWWKKIEAPRLNEEVNHRTIKRCPGFMDFFKKTYTVPLSTELMFVIENKDYFIEASDGSIDTNEIKTSHPSYQRGAFFTEPKYSHVKVPVPWVATCSHDIDIIVSSPCYNNSEVFFDKINVLNASKNLFYDSSMHWHFILNKTVNSSFIIEADTPMYHFSPITEKRVIVRTHYDPQKYKELFDFNLLSSFGFESSFYKMKRFLKKYKK